MQYTLTDHRSLVHSYVRYVSGRSVVRIPVSFISSTLGIIVYIQEYGLLAV
jgi:hypothetical protein